MEKSVENVEWDCEYFIFNENQNIQKRKIQTFSGYEVNIIRKYVQKFLHFDQIAEAVDK